MSLDPGQFNHLALPTSDPARAERFYCDLLGFEVVPRPSFSFDGRWLYRAEVGPMIHLIHNENCPPPTGPIDTRAGHFAMQCADIERAKRVLAEHEIEVVERQLPDFGYRQIFFRDADGNLVELGEWPELSEMVATQRKQDDETADERG